jgi:hypothetical protein
MSVHATNQTGLRRVVTGSCVRIGLLALMTAIAVPATSFAHGGIFDPNVIHACVNQETGAVRVVSEEQTCREIERPLHWFATTRSTSLLAFSSGNEKVGASGPGWFYPIGHGHVGGVGSSAASFTTKIVVPAAGQVKNLVAEVKFTPTSSHQLYYWVLIGVSPAGSDIQLGSNISCYIYSDQNTCADSLNVFGFAPGDGIVVSVVTLDPAAPMAEATATVQFEAYPPALD